MSGGQRSKPMQSIWKSLGVGDSSPWNDREPVRAELFSVERLEDHARSLAAAQAVATKPSRGHSLAGRLAENEEVLRSAFRATILAVKDGVAITPAAEWLIDNYHLVERQISGVRADLPPGYYRQLPKLVSGHFAGYPRVLGVAWAYVAHSDGRFDVEILRRFIRAYQEVRPLTIGELWAVSITLRIVLIEDLRRVATRIEQSLAGRQQADNLADRLLGIGDRLAELLPAILAERQALPLSDAFAVQLVYRLRDQNSGVALALTWLDAQLAEQGTTTDAVVRREQERQVTATLTVRNIITSMRLISEVDWLELFERMCPVDDVLSADSAFRAMDFPTRNLYRTAIEEMARGSRWSEIEIAAAAVGFAKRGESDADGSTSRRADPGYYLLATGRRAFEAEIGYRVPANAWLKRVTHALGIGGYAAAILVSAAFMLLAPMPVLTTMGVSLGWLAILAILGAIPVLDAAVGLVNAGVMRSVSATLLPALELREGVPPELRTLVAVPMLLTNRDAINEQIEGLEIHHLASLEGDVHFALLSDWTDAQAEHADGDEVLLAVASEGIARLNAKYGPAPGGARFLLLHRRRVWNESESRWIGWERKRGKLGELNRLLRGATNTTFITAGGQPATAPDGVRFVITLDADTRLPRETVRRLIGKLAHPLNRPRLDPQMKRVVEGYGILQPRITPSLPERHEGSLFQRIFSSPSGIDPYASAVSDVYQDLFGEGSYAGKGIYDVDAFEASLERRVPESTLLSHDLFEGVFARAGLVSDVELIEEFPTRYDVATRRHHRWARGDWQLLPWILGLWGGGSAGVPTTGRWKMVDNLRRSLTAPACILALFVGWGAMPLPAAAVWTAFLLTVMTVPLAIPLIEGLLHRPTGSRLRDQMGAMGSHLRLAAARLALMVVFLADQAWTMGDAILRTLFRLVVTRRHLLEWVPAAQATSGPRPGTLGHYRLMGGGVLIALIGLFVAWRWDRGTWPLAMAFCFLWAASPAVARWVSAAPSPPRRLLVSLDDVQTLRRLARRTWRFFEVFVTPDDNMLPPDNFQDNPTPVLAHRTSPTNIGLYLLSVASARDFGWIGTVEAVERLEKTLSTMGRLERFRGHFYNWYETRDLRVLEPRYVSSVDSGNLAGHLIALANGCREWREHSMTTSASLGGAEDALWLAREALDASQQKRRASTPGWRQLDASLADLSTRIGDLVTRGNLDRPRLAELEELAELAELEALAEAVTHVANSLSVDAEEDGAADIAFWTGAIQRTIESHRRDLAAAGEDGSMTARLSALEETARRMALSMEFGFLLDDDRKLLSIGYLTPEGTQDPNCYDLLASEARLASFLAIAKGDVPARHWFRLGHAVTPVRGGAVLTSWSGSMFEYLMPALVMRSPAGSLLERTERRIVTRQIDYGRQIETPWGISESAYSARDLEFTYQYSNFGVPGLGLKRGLGENAVIAPYATALATMVEPHAAVRNFRLLAIAGGLGRYGFYEALDYTPSRVPDGKKVVVVGTFMAHHQGMTIVALANTVLAGVMRERFHAEPMVKAAELLLQERMPRQVTVTSPSVAEEGRAAGKVTEIEAAAGRRIASPHGQAPMTHLLSNGRYTVMLTAAGSGYSRWRDLALTRWREDATCDDWGSYVFLRDVHNGDVWSAGYQPTGREPDTYSATFNEDRAEFARCDGDLTTTMEVLVSSEDDAEVRRVTIVNTGLGDRVIEITSYAELALAPQASDVAHPAFSKLFVETEFLGGAGALLARRRRRDPAEDEVWTAHLVVVEGETVGKLEFETDRAQFVGRGNGIRAPRAVVEGRPLTGSTGTVLDPVFALRTRLRLAPGTTARATYWTMVGSTRRAVLDLIDKHHDVTAFERAAALAWTQAQVQLRHLGLTAGDAGQFQRLASHLIFASPGLRAASEVIAQGAAAQPGLWSLGVSGDLPIILLRIADIEDLAVARELLQAMDYWRMKRLAFDVIVLNDRGTSYVQDLQNALEALVRASQSRAQFEERPPGAVFVLRTDLIPEATQALLLSVARVVLIAQNGRLANVIGLQAEDGAAQRPFSTGAARGAGLRVAPRPPDLEFYNGLGGFGKDGREYVVVLGPGQNTPAPWINVVANPNFGFQASAEGAGYTWAVNSRERQLTPWSNDPVQDRSGQAFYVRDDDTGELWSPTASPFRDDAGAYVARHGRGYCRFEHATPHFDLELLEYVPTADALKISRLTIRNTSNQQRRLSVTAYVEWVLGPSRAAAAPFTVTEIDSETGAMFARNRWNAAFGERVAFVDLCGRQTSWTGDRREFIGRNGALDNPAALAGHAPLSNQVGAGLDPCGAMQAQVVVAANSSIELIFFLGDAASADEARALLGRYRTIDLDGVLDEVHRYWDDVLGAVQVRTPDRSLDIMLNGWLLYQTLACRVWARSAFYQASGAYGFRDQLQDVMALTTTRPIMAREQLIRAAGRQFREGDVQHWWLPHTGQGVRTRFSDDRVWLAFVTAHYLATTDESGILEVDIPFLSGPVLTSDEVENFFLPETSDVSATLYEHCALALDASLKLGSHGLPLIGGGDWNDGMNRVGRYGKGESVWLGWFLHSTLTAFVPIAQARREEARAQAWIAHAAALRDALEREAWDGDWYRRGWFDDGEPLGSSASDECRIDSIAQSWAVISGAGGPDRVARAMAAVERELILPETGLALLFAPPFDQTLLDPGYIKGYPPGVRENGGQYTHASLWSVIAFAALGDGDKAASLLALLNPINHSRTRSEAHRYKLEPYVVAADVYSKPPHVGRGGWSWYTGAAGWMQRAGVEYVLGLRIQGAFLHLDPCIPRTWPGYEVTLRHGSDRYEITVENPDGVCGGVAIVEYDGVIVHQRPLRLAFKGDGQTHSIIVKLGVATRAAPGLGD